MVFIGGGGVYILSFCKVFGDHGVCISVRLELMSCCCTLPTLLTIVIGVGGVRSSRSWSTSQKFRHSGRVCPQIQG